MVAGAAGERPDVFTPSCPPNRRQAGRSAPGAYGGYGGTAKIHRAALKHDRGMEGIVRFTSGKPAPAHRRQQWPISNRPDAKARRPKANNKPQFNQPNIMNDNASSSEKLAGDLKRIVRDSEELLQDSKVVVGEKAHEMRERLA